MYLTFFPQGHGLGAVDHMLAVVFFCVVCCCVTGMINKTEEKQNKNSVQTAGVATHLDTLSI